MSEVDVKVEATGINKIMDELWDSIFVAGVNNSLLMVMNLTFLFLLLSLLALLYITGGNLHVIALVIVAIALFSTINWFIFEINKVKAKEIYEEIKDEKKKKDKKEIKNQKGLKQRTKKAH